MEKSLWFIIGPIVRVKRYLSRETGTKRRSTDWNYKEIPSSVRRTFKSSEDPKEEDINGAKSNGNGVGYQFGQKHVIVVWKGQWGSSGWKLTRWKWIMNLIRYWYLIYGSLWLNCWVKMNDLSFK